MWIKSGYGYLVDLSKFEEIVIKPVADYHRVEARHISPHGVISSTLQEGSREECWDFLESVSWRLERQGLMLKE